MTKLFAYKSSTDGAITFIQTDDATCDAQWGAAQGGYLLNGTTYVAEAWLYPDATLNGSTNGISTFTGQPQVYFNPNLKVLANPSNSPQGGACAFTAGTARYAGPTGANAVDTTNTIQTRMVMSKPWTISGLYIELDAAAGSGKTVTVCIMKNGVDTAVTAAATGTVATTGSDIAHSASGDAGDDVCIHISSTSGGSAAKVAWGYNVLNNK